MTGVLGLLVVPSRLVGVPGTGGSTDFGLLEIFDRDSTERGALYFLCVDDRRLGVAVARAIRPERSLDDDEVDAAERGLFGVNGVGRLCLKAPGVLGTI